MPGPRRKMLGSRAWRHPLIRSFMVFAENWEREEQSTGRVWRCSMIGSGQAHATVCTPRSTVEISTWALEHKKEYAWLEHVLRLSLWYEHNIRLANLAMKRAIGHLISCGLDPDDIAGPAGAMPGIASVLERGAGRLIDRFFGVCVFLDAYEDWAPYAPSPGPGGPEAALANAQGVPRIAEALDYAPELEAPHAKPMHKVSLASPERARELIFMLWCKGVSREELTEYVVRRGQNRVIDVSVFLRRLVDGKQDCRTALTRLEHALLGLSGGPAPYSARTVHLEDEEFLARTVVFERQISELLGLLAQADNAWSVRAACHALLAEGAKLGCNIALPPHNGEVHMHALIKCSTGIVVSPAAFWNYWLSLAGECLAHALRRARVPAPCAIAVALGNLTTLRAGEAASRRLVWRDERLDRMKIVDALSFSAEASFVPDMVSGMLRELVSCGVPEWVLASMMGLPRSACPGPDIAAFEASVRRGEELGMLRAQLLLENYEKWEIFRDALSVGQP